MTRRHGLGEYEELLLLAVQGAGGSAYASEVRQTLEQSGRRGALTVILTGLARAELKGYLAAEVTPSRAVPGGRKRLLWHLTVAGRAALAAAALCRVKIQGAMERKG